MHLAFTVISLPSFKAFLEEVEAKKAADEKRTPQDWIRQVKIMMGANKTTQGAFNDAGIIMNSNI